MSRAVSDKEYDIIEEAISAHPNGIGIAALERVLTPHYLKGINRRTLQRRLKYLLAEGRIEAKGRSIALVYKKRKSIAVKIPPIVDTESLDLDAEIYIPISPESRDIRRYVRQPLIKRQPVGYQRSFLESYEPAVTYYLDKSLRDQFHEMGLTSINKRPAGTYARNILNRLLIDLSWASSRLEGNTYTRLDTKNLIEFGQAAAGKDIQETQMILNHKAAIEMLIEEADQIGFDPFTFRNLHAILSENLLPDESSCGRLRRRPVDISGSVFHPLAMPQVIEECFLIILKKAAAIPDPFEQAFFIMVHLPYLQPFEDVNKRLSRLGANISLIRYNLCPLSFVDVLERVYIDGTLAVYEQNRIELLCELFTWAYERSCQRYLAIKQSMPEPDPLRIRYREALNQTVQFIIRNYKRPTAQNILPFIEKWVQSNDREAFVAMTLETLQNIHEGNVARFRLKLSEFLKWKPIREKHDPIA